jgi:hypothetical protein
VIENLSYPKYRTSAREHEPIMDMTVWLAVLLFPAVANAANLKPETRAAWDDYLRTSDSNLQMRCRPDGSFLWSLENADRADRVRKGEIVVASAAESNPRKVPGGLIHHWVGAMFLRSVKLEDIRAVTRDYDHYKDYYRPSVIDSKAISSAGPEDEFSMVLVEKVFFLKTALEANYHSTLVRLDDRRVYSISRTTNLQEVGESSREGESYIWKLYNITRLEEQDAGVYYEFETIALSREIPGALRLVAEPIVRRVARESILTSLQKTREAVCHRGHTI